MMIPTLNTPLHSTMFLLIRYCRKQQWPVHVPLHSTMFLLIPSNPTTIPSIKYAFTFHNVSINTDGLTAGTYNVTLFTFHNVSINTMKLSWMNILIWSLHSTMFLLIRDCSRGLNRRTQDFTFHNVSINTGSRNNSSDSWATLHSTMFLLIPKLKAPKGQYNSFFTYHNVSINTRGGIIMANLIGITLHSTMFLLILELMKNNHDIHAALHSTMFLLILRELQDRLMIAKLYIPQCFY